MRVVRLRHGYHHWVYDGFETYCGRRLVDLHVEAEYEIDHLPTGELCIPCEANRQADSRSGLPHITLPASRGFLRKTGPLYHGFLPRYGTKLHEAEE